MAVSIDDRTCAVCQVRAKLLWGGMLDVPKQYSITDNGSIYTIQADCVDLHKIMKDRFHRRSPDHLQRMFVVRIFPFHAVVLK